MKFIAIFILGIYGFVPSSVFSTTLLEVTSDEIRAEALRKNDAELGKPLPLAAHWNSGHYKTGQGFTPEYQLGLISKGHHILPWFHLSAPIHNQPSLDYYGKLSAFSKLMLPISFISTQWEIILTEDPKFYHLIKDDNPNVISLLGVIEKKVSPFGPVSHWEEAGHSWTSRSLVAKLQSLYPDPELILFISNNEHKKLRWYESIKSKRYMKKFGPLHDDDFMRRVVGNGWVERYRAFQSGMKRGLERDAWKKNSKFIGYNAFGTSAFGRWPGWLRHSLYTTGRSEPWPLAWDGASVPYYVHNWDHSTDHTVMSPQVQSMNWVFMLKEALHLNSSFWFEISTWDGHEPLKENDKRKYYEKLGQDFNPLRYEGMVQFGMWLLRPRIVREFRGWTDTVEHSGAYFNSILRSVDRVYKNSLLRKFWRKGILVPNKKHSHPYQTKIPHEFQNKNRWFLLDVDVNPNWPWKLDTKIAVFSLALVLGEAPDRKWLVYTYSPLQNYSNLELFLPGYGAVSTNSRTSGYFTIVEEKTRKVSPVGQ